MNDYAKLVAHAAAKFTGRPAVLSPLLDSYCGWENKKSRFSSEPAKGDFRIILSAGGLLFEELEINLELEEKVNEDLKKGQDKGAKPSKEYEGRLKIAMQHGSKKLGDNNFKWSRDCSYEYAISTALSPLRHNFSVYWTNDDFLVIQARNLENPLLIASDVEDLLKFRLIPTEVIDVLEPALNVPFLKQILTAIKKKSNEVCSYVNAATETSDAKDVLSLLTCIPLKEGKKEFDFAKLKLDAEEAAGQSS
ncbi:unnamed protein product [Larinioides sclopetarius]|uniref:FACT complex subunit n=1 Tax=Larinioides sclopetarius TaxID=280406 RepID=A0AAV2AMJ0_9ARAC